MAWLKEDDQREIKKVLSGLAHDVKLLMFTQERECEGCGATREIVNEIAALSERVTVEVRDFVADGDLVKQHGIARVPAVAVLGDRDYGVRFYGVPAGYEFAALLEAILAVGRRDAGLPPPVLAEVAKIDRPVHLQVMVTPT